METDKEIMENRTKKITRWLKDPYSLAFIGVILAAFAVRIYFFVLTKNQAVWWDEGEYMLRVNHLVLGTPQSGFFVGRELFTPYFWALIYTFFRSEIAIRLVQVLISTLTVAATYFLGKEVYNKKVGLLAATFMTFFWLHLFFTARLLTYLYPPLFYTLVLALFWKGYCTDSPRKNIYLFLSFLTTMIGLGIYFSIVFAAIPILIYLIVTERFAFLKNRRLWKYFLLSLPFLLLSFIPSYIIQGSFVPRLSQGASVLSKEAGAGLAGIVSYVGMMPRLMLSVWLTILVLSLFVLVRMFFYFDFVTKQKGNITEFRKDFFIFLIILIPLAFYTWISMVAGGPSGAVYDAYILICIPAIFVLMSRFLSLVSSYLRKFTSYKKVVWVLIMIVVLIGAYGQIKFADQSIKGKLDSYYNLKPAGEWLKENTAQGDLILSQATPELTYYSQREVISFDYRNTSEILELIKSKKPAFMVLTLWERSPDDAYKLPETNLLNLSIANAYFIESDGQKQPDVIIYKINY